MNRLDAFKASALGRCANPPGARTRVPDLRLRGALPTSGWMVPVTATPLYDALLGERLAPLRAVAALHDGDTGQPCPACGLGSPCPTSRVLAGELTAEQARAEARRERVARAVADAATASAASGPPTGVPGSTAVDDRTGDRTDPLDDGVRSAPVLPSAAELFAPNPGTSRALDALLGGPARR
jgi:hypothetical protein